MIEQNPTMGATALLPDRAIQTGDEDLLNRTVFAHALANQILHAPPATTMRLGVYGGWGEGKTSVLLLMRRQLEEKGHLCLWLAPWAAQTRDEVLRAVLEQLAEQLEIDPASLQRAQRAAGAATRMRDAASAGAWWAVATEKFFGERVQQRLDRHVAGEIDQFLAAVTQKLGERKVVVFVDDLDRVRADLIAQLLLTLREALDRANFFYILALAPEVVERGLEAHHAGWGSATEFLEKIVEFPRYLPRPSDRDIELFIQKATAVLGSAAIDMDALRAIMPLLPRNPRKLKLFLRTMTSLAGILGRFESSEIDLARLYAVQLLRSEFPAETRRLLTDPTAMQDLEHGAFRDRLSEKDGKETVAPGDKYLPANMTAAQKRRFDELFHAAQRRALLQRGRYGITELLALPDAPPLVTWRELGAFVGAYKHANPEARLDLLQQFVSRDGNIDPYRAEAVFLLVLEWRHAELARAADTALAEDLRTELQDVHCTTDILARFIEELQGFSHSLLSLTAWKALLEHVCKWAHFTKPDEYKASRRNERVLLTRAVESMHGYHHAEVLESLEADARDSEPGDHSTFIHELHSQLARKVGAATVDAFRRPDGLESLLGGVGGRTAKDLLFRSDSAVFADADLLSRFNDLAASSASDTLVQRNFVEYVGLLLYGATEGGGTLSREESRALLQKADLISIIWRAALSRPLNPRTAGGLRKRRERLVTDGIIPREHIDHLLPLPKWWQDLEATFFSEE